MKAAPHTRPEPADELVDVVVARGRSLFDATGAQVLAGQTAKLAASEVARLIEAGFIVDPEDKPAERIARHTGEADRRAWNLHVTAHNAATIADVLRPNRPGGELRAQQLAQLAEEIRTDALRLLALLRDGETDQPAKSDSPICVGVISNFAPTKEQAS